MEGSLDLGYAKKVADYLGTDHTEVLFTPEEGLEAIPEVIYNLESYDITTVRASVGMYLLGKYISQNTNDKVIFSGEGSDELFCGYLYFHYAPTANEANTESIRLIRDMYKYDVLRADRCISCNGLELRVPFLDPDVIEYAKSIDPELKAPNGNIEKKILRDAFKGMLLEEVLYRRKDGFSDGVSGKAKPWYQYINEYTNGKEGEWYKEIYLNYFRHYPNPIDYYWMPKWIECGNNPSGRVLGVF
jgi:asparagine synthase (glutamine-hydrolysing)